MASIAEANMNALAVIFAFFCVVGVTIFAFLLSAWAEIIRVCNGEDE